MKVLFDRLATAEIQDACEFYEYEQPGLGKRFRRELKRGILRIVEHPKAWSIERGEVRRCLLHKFPYKILYSVEQDHIYVIAVAHCHRRPDYWVNRLSEPPN